MGFWGARQPNRLGDHPERGAGHHEGLATLILCTSMRSAHRYPRSPWWQALLRTPWPTCESRKSVWCRRPSGRSDRCNHHECVPASGVDPQDECAKAPGVCEGHYAHESKGNGRGDRARRPAFTAHSPRAARHVAPHPSSPFVSRQRQVSSTENHGARGTVPATAPPGATRPEQAAPAASRHPHPMAMPMQECQHHPAPPCMPRRVDEMCARPKKTRNVRTQRPCASLGEPSEPTSVARLPHPWSNRHQTERLARLAADIQT